jgi:hypothetical protein
MAIYRHVKRGTFYSVIGTLVLSCQGEVAEGAILKAIADEADGQTRLVPEEYTCTNTEEFMAKGGLQTERPLHSGDILVWYVSRDNPDENWFRPVTEFDDGRFVRMD